MPAPGSSPATSATRSTGCVRSAPANFRPVRAAARGSLELTRWRLIVDPLDVRSPDGAIAGSLALRATEPLGLRTNLRGEWRFPDDAFEYRFRAETRGRLDRLAAELYLDSPAQLSFSGTLLDLAEKGVAQLSAAQLAAAGV